MSTDADRIVQPGVVHYAIDYSTGDQEVPTACGRSISTWAETPDERATSHDKDTTCPTCLRHVATRLRQDLDEACADPGGWRLKAVRRGLQLRIAKRDLAAERAAHERRIRRDTIGALGLVAFAVAPVWLVLAWAWTHQRRERGR